jgi:hypothetical protein
MELTKSFSRAGSERGAMEPGELESYNDWLAEHMHELAAQYPGRVVVIQESHIAFVGDSEVEAYQWARAAGCARLPLVLRVPSEEDLQSVL